MNTPGTSLIAVASPISAPRGQRGSRTVQSSMHRTTRKMSICPKCSSWRIGIRKAQNPNSTANTAGA